MQAGDFPRQKCYLCNFTVPSSYLLQQSVQSPFEFMCTSSFCDIVHKAMICHSLAAEKRVLVPLRIGSCSQEGQAGRRCHLFIRSHVRASLSVSRQIIHLSKEAPFVPRHLASHLKTHCSNTHIIESAHTSGYTLDTHQKKSLREESCNFLHIQTPDPPSNAESRCSSTRSHGSLSDWGKNRERETCRLLIVGQAEQSVSGGTLN